MERSVVNIRTDCVYASSRPIEILTNFLIDDVGGRSIDSLLEWINDDKYDFSILNYSYLKKDGGKIYIYFFYDGYGKKEDKKRERFETTKEHLIDIAKKWEKAYKEKYSYTLLFLKNNMIEIVGKGTAEHARLLNL